MILWRQLFDAIGVRWIDRGHNTGRGHVNIACPWCGPADPSYHLGIEEATGAFYCLRGCEKGRGRSTPYLLHALNVPSFQIDTLLREFSDDTTPVRSERYHDTSKWDQFKSAADNAVAIDYLSDPPPRGRGLEPASVLARRYDMRFTTGNNPNSWRILLPLRLNFEIVGWTGRAIRDSEPTRYRAYDPSEGAALYIPFYPVAATHTIVIVEGPFDAIAISDAYFPTHEVIAIAIIGLQMNTRRRQHLADIIGLAGTPRVLLTLDNDQPRNIVENFTNVLARGTGIPHPQSFPLPPDAKDAGEMTRGQIRTWLANIAG